MSVEFAAAAAAVHDAEVELERSHRMSDPFAFLDEEEEEVTCALDGGRQFDDRVSGRSRSGQASDFQGKRLARAPDRHACRLCFRAHDASVSTACSLYPCRVCRMLRP